MENAFDESELMREFEGVPHWKVLVFILVICQRLIPSFRAFSAETGFSGEKVLTSFIEKAWETLGAGISVADYSNEMKVAETVAPDTEEHESSLASSALDSAVAVSLLMKAFQKEQTKAALEVASLSRDSVDMYIQDIDHIDPLDPELEVRILSHDLMQKELQRQREDLEFLNELDDNILISIEKVQARWKNDQSSCLGLV